MGIIQTLRGFHWVTKIVIALTVLLLGLLAGALVTGAYWMAHQSDKNALAVNQGLGQMVFSLCWILLQVFLLILIAIAIYMAVMAVKAWIEKYLDAVLAKLDTLSEQKAERETTGAALAIMTGKMDGMEKKLENIERILTKVSE